MANLNNAWFNLVAGTSTPNIQWCKYLVCDGNQAFDVSAQGATLKMNGSNVASSWVVGETIAPPNGSLLYAVQTYSPSLELNLRPALYNGKPCLYNVINNEPHFNVGSVVPTYDLLNTIDILKIISIMYAKIENNQLKKAPRQVTLGDRLIINPTASQYAEAGYYPVEVTECEEREGYYSTPKYSIVDGAIVQSWEYHEIENVEEDE